MFSTTPHTRSRVCTAIFPARSATLRAASWGVVTYHYGRWYEDPREGWVWVPGSTWAPAWVSWREGGGYCGWALRPVR